MSVDVIIVSYNTRELLRACLRSVFDTASDVEDLSVFVTDNASTDGSAEMVVAEFPAVRLIRAKKNLGFGRANNAAVAQGHSEYLLLLNSDARLTPGTLQTLLDAMAEQPNCVALGPRLEYPDGRFQLSLRNRPTFARNLWVLTGLEARFHGHIPALDNWLTEAAHCDGQKVEMLSFACALLRRGFWESLGGIDPNLFLYEEETDLFVPALRGGFDVRYCAHATVVHEGGQSVEQNDLGEFSAFHRYKSKYYVFRKHDGVFMAWLTYWTDRLIFARAALTARLRGRPNPMVVQRRICPKAWRASFGD